MNHVAQLRQEYQLKSLLESDVALSAMEQFAQWWEEAVSAHIPEPNAMTLATASSDGLPSARIVLMKGFDEKGISFFTNYDSFKGRQLQENPRACLVFLWKELERQVRVTGLTEKVSADESDDYFTLRPEGSKLGAWSSPQSQVIPDRDWLERNEQQFKQEFSGKPIPRPDHWGGYRVKPITVEFWQGRPNRLHDRILYSLQEDGNWLIERLAP